MKAKAENKEKELALWEKNLVNILQENALLKYRLSEIVDENQEKDFLPIAEYFQNELLLKDEKLRLLLKEINGFASIEQKDCNDLSIEKYEKLRQEILNFQKEYHSFSEDFKLKCYKKSLD